MGTARGQQPPGATGRCRTDRGATLIEAAIVSLPFLVLLFGILEFGLVFRDYLTVANATRVGARMGATEGSSQSADFRILDAVSRGSSVMPRASIEQIVVWKASGPGDSAPSSCLSGGGSNGLCNVYEVDDFAWDQDDFDCDPGNGGPPDWDWCATDRKDYIEDPDGPGPLETGTDYLGIRVEGYYTFITGLFGDRLDFSDDYVVRLEPQRLGDS